MKTRIEHIIVAAILSAVLTTTISCEKFVETDFPNNQLPTEVVFEDEQTAEAALAGLYAGLWTNSLISGGIDGMGALMGTYTDDLTCVYTSGSNGILDIANNQQVVTNTVVTTAWTNAYGQIYAANSIIEGVTNSKSLSQASKDRIKGEALLVRSIIYFNLYQIFGEIAYTETTNYFINSHLGRMNKDQFLIKLETDLSEAVNLLPSAYRNAERIYPNKFAGYMALAKMKILLKKWAEAEVLCSTILQSSQYTFQTDPSKVFQKSGTHIIWQLKPKNTNDATKEASLYNFTGAPLLLLSVCSYLYRNANIPYYRQENSYLYWNYEMLTDWISEDEEIDENHSSKKELQQAEIIGDFMEQKIFHKNNVEVFGKRLETFKAKNNFDKECFQLSKKVFQLYNDYPEESIFRNAHFNNIQTEENTDDDFYNEEKVVTMDKYISFFADDKGLIYQNLIDSVNNDFNEYSELQEPMITKVFDGSDIPKNNLDFENRLFGILIQLSTLLGD